MYKILSVTHMAHSWWETHVNKHRLAAQLSNGWSCDVMWFSEALAWSRRKRNTIGWSGTSMNSRACRIFLWKSSCQCLITFDSNEETVNSWNLSTNVTVACSRSNLKYLNSIRIIRHWRGHHPMLLRSLPTWFLIEISSPAGEKPRQIGQTSSDYVRLCLVPFPCGNRWISIVPWYFQSFPYISWGNLWVIHGKSQKPRLPIPLHLPKRPIRLQPLIFHRSAKPLHPMACMTYITTNHGHGPTKAPQMCHDEVQSKRARFFSDWACNQWMGPYNRSQPVTNNHGQKKTCIFLTVWHQIRWCALKRCLFFFCFASTPFTSCYTFGPASKVVARPLHPASMCERRLRQVRITVDSSGIVSCFLFAHVCLLHFSLFGITCISIRNIWNYTNYCFQHWERGLVL